jgi:hypothetical protein
MKILITVTRDTAISAIMQYLYFNDGEVKRMNKNIFKEIIKGFIFGVGESTNGDVQTDYEQYYHQADDIVEKYLD